MVSAKSVLDAHLLGLPPKVIDYISPSQLGKCHRAHYYKIKHIEPLIRPTKGALANFQVGFLWEELIKQALESQKIPFTYQDEFYDPELNMKGSSDFIVAAPDAIIDGTEINWKTTEGTMWDSKTMASMWFKYRQSKKKRNQYDWWEENYGYVIQQGAYLLMAKRLGYKVDKAVLVFISKDDGFIGEELTILLTPKLEAEVMKRVTELNGYLKRDEVPPCTCEGWLVSYCDYGNPNSLEPNAKKKMVATQCCGDPEDLEDWRKEKQGA